MRDYEQFENTMRQIADLSGALATMHWDTEVNMPDGGAPYRSQHIATLSGIAHEMFTAASFGDLLTRLSEEHNLSEDQRINVMRTREDYDKQLKLTKSFVEQLSAARSRAYQQWVKAKSANDFSMFAEALDGLVQLKRLEAKMRGYEDEPYDALLDTYEPGLKAATVETLFSQARQVLLPIISELPKSPPPEFLHRSFDKDKQWDFGIEILKAIGYDFNRGRQDMSPHPFTISFSPGDVRVTTRVDEHDFSNMTWSCIHEGGHALYEQGLRADQYGMPLGSAASLAIHESQSRLWENHVGRSLEFWQNWYPKLKEKFPEPLGDISLQAFYRAINHIAPNLIRTEADELHYHLHVMIRFEIERACVNGDIQTSELRSLWNEKYRSYLGIDVPDDAQGILQDVHWSHGSFGYFPTYSIGSFYAAQFYAAAENAIPDLSHQIANGKYQELLGWLKQNIHVHGRTYYPEDLCAKVTGNPLDVKYFVAYIQKKLETRTVRT